MHAVASRAGVICEVAGRHADNAVIDATLRYVGQLDPQAVFTNVVADVQLKATCASPTEVNGQYSYSLKLKNYDELRSTKTVSPQILVVLYLPPDHNQWIVHSADLLASRRCAYWVSLRGASASTNSSSETVYIPKTNVVSPDGLKDLMTRFSRNEKIDYAPN